MEQLKIRMFGEFSVQMGDKRISERDSRSKKVWMILAYLICRWDRTVSQNELIGLIWGDDPASDNPENVLKVTLHRVRTMLDKLWPGAGHELIQRREDGYRWNREISAWRDTEEFEALCASRGEEENILADRLKALELYQGEFLQRQSTGTWVIPIAAHYQNLYLQTVLQAGKMLYDRGDYARADRICSKAISMEPYHEGLHQMRMEALMASGDYNGAVQVFTDLEKQLFQVFGIHPGEEIRTLYRQAARTMTDTGIPMETVAEHLLEREPEAGALQCDFDCFKVLCHAEARAMLRSGNATHVALLSVREPAGKALSRRSIDRVMKNLGEQVRINLRRGDAFSRCSVSQYIMMLPQANYENSCMVCRRVIGAFQRRYPHSPVKIEYMVHPLTPPELGGR